MLAFSKSILLLITALINLSEGNQSLHLKIGQGDLCGKFWKTRKGRTVSGFSGIPYAKAPINNLRFKVAVPHEGWNGVLDATKPHAVCPQINYYDTAVPILGSEDCLFLNVYTPQIPSNSSNGKTFPVLFYIHGGSFSIGSARYDWLGPEILLDRDIVLVTVNYRLGALGFLSTGDDVVSGNNGLKDQLLALKWVKDNIISFGGDPHKITLCGNSAGASSVHLHTFSPLNKDLITNVIVQSGSGISAFAISSRNESVHGAHQLGDYLNCSFTSNNALINCLRNVDAYEIVKYQSQFPTWNMDSVSTPFKPVVEGEIPGAFLTQNPLDILKTNQVLDVPMIIGMVAQEGAYVSADTSNNPVNLNELNLNFDAVVSKEFRLLFENSSKILREFYFNNKPIDNTTKSEISDLFTDGSWLWEIDYTVKNHLLLRKQPIYLYLFEYKGSITYASLFDDSTFDYGVCHTDELFYLLTRDVAFPGYNPTDSDNEITDTMTYLWTNFITFGHPTPGNMSNVPIWNKVLSEDLEYYHITHPNATHMNTGLLMNRTKLWRTIPIDLQEYN